MRVNSHPPEWSGEPIADGTLRVESSDDAAPLLRGWRPRLHPAPGAGRCRLSVGVADRRWQATPSQPTGPRVLRVGSVGGWVDDERGEVTLRGQTGEGRLSLTERRGSIDPRGEKVDALSLLTIATGVLLGTVGQLLMHAGATVAPDGRAWLVVGDSQAGKSTTVLTLARAGWGWMSDDTVALASGPGGEVFVHAWARVPHVDVGWEEGQVTGRRHELPAARVGPGPWQSTAPLGGLLFPCVESSASTGVYARSAVDAFAGLVRQAPWAVVSRHIAGALTRLAQRVAEHPAFTLRLGLDSYNRPERMAAILATAVSRHAA